jgi:hypothetical protein
MMRRKGRPTGETFMNARLIAWAFCAGMFASAPAAAKEDGKLDPSRDTTASMESYKKLLTYGDCIMGQGESAASILTAKPYSRSERDKTGLLRQRVKLCPAKDLQNIHSLVRGAFAEAMYRRQVTTAPTVDAARTKAFIESEKLFQSERDKNDQVMAQVMSCMVAASPASAHALLATEHGTAAEATAMDAYFAAGAQCGAGSKRPANLSRSFIRAFVADSAWRLARGS